LIFNAAGLRLLGAEAVGIVNIALSMAVLVSLPVSAGVAPALSRYLPLLESGDGRTALRRWALGAGAVGMLAPALIFLLVYGAILRLPYGALFAPMVLLWSGLYALYSLCRADLFAAGSPTRALWLEGAGVGLFALGMAVLVAGGTGAWVPFSVYYVPAAAWIVVRTLRAGADAHVPVAPRELRAFALYSLLGSAASLGIAYFTTVVVSASSGLASAGLWATLLSVAAPLLLAPRTLNSSFFPRLSRLGRTNPDGFARLCRVHQRFASLLALGSVGAALVLARPLLGLAVGEVSSAALMPSWTLICIACYGIFRGEPLITACGALGRARLTALAAFAGAGVCAGFWIALLPGAGMPGVAAGYMAYTLVVPVIVLVASRLRGPAPPAYFFPSDGAFAAVVLLIVLGLGDANLARIAALTVVVLALAHGLVRTRRELRGLHGVTSEGSAAPA
jgi:O-antigen/teichoic acid export membrane protein